MIGTGNPKIRSFRFRVMVFFKALIKSLDLNAFMKYSKPWFLAQGISQIL